MKRPLNAHLRVQLGDHAGNLLYRMFYWYDRATIKSRGTMWVAKTSTEWMFEVGLSKSQYHRSLASLKSLDLIRTRQAVFSNRNVTHITITEKGLELRDVPDENIPPPSHQCETQGSQICETQGSHQCETPITTLTTVSYSNTGGVAATGAEVLDVPETEVTVGKIDDLMMSSKLVKTPKKSDTVEVKTGSLAVHWLNAVNAATGKYAGSASTKLKGQLKHVAAKCQDAGVDPYDLIDMVASNWIEFCIEVKDQAAKKKVPEFPNVGFFLTNIDVAIRMSLQSIAPDTSDIPEQDEEWFKNAKTKTPQDMVASKKDIADILGD